MKTILKEVTGQLRKECPFLKTIEADLGQLESGYGESRRPPVVYPAVLLSVSVDRTTDITEKLQECAGTLTVRYATDRVGETGEKSLLPYNEASDIYAALQGYSTEHFSPLSRRSGSPDARKGLFAYRWSFALAFVDETAI